MRSILCAFLLACLAPASLAAQTAGSLFATPSVPMRGAPVTLMLSASSLPAGPVAWDFGDGQSQSGGTVMSHVYVAAGFFTVRATYVPLRAQLPVTASLQLHVALPTGPAAPFAISALRLRWEDGRTDQSVDRGFAPLVAYADLKFEGTGLLQAQWTVDGVPLGTFALQLAFANTAQIDTRNMLPLPTTEPGEHLVSLRILSPLVGFRVPAIRYFVRQAGQEPPRVDAVLPAVLARGQDVEVQLRGFGLVKGVKVSFGRGVALVAPLRVTGPGQATARIFVSPTAREGHRKVHVVGPSGRSEGPATLQIVRAVPES
ncbi:MAG TPA: PKD domain-containing protein [Geothrix sp.]|nr:PKD domain-containing protein [Geothrix sp.]